MIPIRDSVPSRTTPLITYLLIAVNVGVFLYMHSLHAEQLHFFIVRLGFVPVRFSAMIRDGFQAATIEQTFPIFSSLFIHGSWFHLISNMWSLWLFGDNVEDSVGHFNYFLFYILAGVFASLIHYLFNMFSPIPVIGASGAIAAIMGAYVVMFPLARITTLVPLLWIPLFIKVPALFFMGIWFFSQVMSGISTLGQSELGGGIAWWAHIGGFIFGLFVINFIRKRHWRYRCSYDDDQYDCEYD